MTVSAVVNKIAYPGPGGTVFAANFPIVSASDVEVYKTDQTTGEVVGSALVNVTDYTVTGVGGTGFTVTLTADLGAYGLLIRRVEALTMGTNLPDEGNLRASSIQAALDKLARLAQQLQEQLSRSLHTAISGLTADWTVPEPGGDGYVLGTVGKKFVWLAAASAQLAADLLNAVSGAKGAALVWFDKTLTYTAGTVGSFLNDLGTAATTKGAALIGYLAPYAGAVGRTQQTKNTDWVSVKDFGAVGDGVTNDYAAFVAGLSAAAGKTLFVPDPPGGSYIIGTGILTIPNNTTLMGVNKRSTKILHAFNGDALEMRDGARIENICIEGNGGVYTGNGINFTGTNGGQQICSSRVVNFDGPCLNFAYQAGSASYFSDLECYRINGGTGTNRYAIVMDATTNLSAVPKCFIGLETGGYCSFDFGGTNDVFVIGSFLSDLIFTPNSRGINIVGSRIANQTALTLNGHNNSIVGCDINPQVTIASGADVCTVGPGSFNNAPVIDNSGSQNNLVFHNIVSFNSALSSGGTPPTIGNGSISSFYTRSGNLIICNIELTIGSTTSLGTGGLSFSLPTTTSSAMVQECGRWLGNRGGTFYSGIVQIAGAASTASLIRDTTGPVTFNSPATWAAGDTIRVQLTYTK